MIIPYTCWLKGWNNLLARHASHSHSLEIWDRLDPNNTIWIKSEVDEVNQKKIKLLYQKLREYIKRDQKQQVSTII